MRRRYHSTNSRIITSMLEMATNSTLTSLQATLEVTIYAGTDDPTEEGVWTNEVVHVTIVYTFFIRVLHLQRTMISQILRVATPYKVFAV